jgi:hypothetical protein
MWLTHLFASSRTHSRRPHTRRQWSARRSKASRPLAVEPLEDRCLLSATLIKDINPFSIGSGPSNLTDVNGTLFFMATDGSGRELWKSDGTEAFDR